MNGFFISSIQFKSSTTPAYADKVKCEEEGKELPN